MSLHCPDTSNRGAGDGARMKTRTLFLPLFPLFLLACATPDSAPAPAPAPAPSETHATTPSALEAAHESYLRGDWITMNDRLRDVLVDRSASSLVRDNAFELLDKAYEATNGNLPSRFALPPGFQVVSIGSMRGQHPWATYRSIFLYVKVDRGMGAHVKDISLRSLPGTVILDSAAGIGEREDIQLTDEKADEVKLKANKVDAPLPDGVAEIHISLDDGRALDTWVLVRGMGSSASPDVSSPGPSAALGDPSPTFEWTPFKSPEYAPFEARSLSVWVSDEQTKTAAFDRWMMIPANETGSMKVDKKLRPGNYWVAFTFGENRKFGPINMTRASQRGVPFSIVP